MTEKFQIVFEDIGWDGGPLYVHVLFFRYGFGPIWRTGLPDYQYEHSFNLRRLDKKGLRAALKIHRPNFLFELDGIDVCDIRAGGSIYFDGVQLL